MISPLKIYYLKILDLPMNLWNLMSCDNGNSQDFIDLGDICLPPKYGIEYPSMYRNCFQFLTKYTPKCVSNHQDFICLVFDSPIQVSTRPDPA